MTDDIAGLEKHLAELVVTNPHRVTLAWQHALLLADTGQSEAAQEHARRILNSYPGRRDLQDEFLGLLESLHQPKQAERTSVM